MLWHHRGVPNTGVPSQPHDPTGASAESDMQMPMFIGCCCLVTDGHGRYLMVRETKPAVRGRYALPGGKLEPDESLQEAACRETREETGLAVEVNQLLGVFHCARTTEHSFGVTFVFAATVVGGKLTVSPEHPEVRWFSGAEVLELADAGNVRGQHGPEALRRYEAGVTLPTSLLTQVEASPPG